MKTVVQISDLHFGRTDERIVNSLKKIIHSLSPDVLVVSGDLTQRAKNTEFLQAQEFLNNFKYPKIIVPGNHDVPLYNIWKRFVKPYKKFSSLIETSLTPFYSDNEIAVLGLNTSRSLTFKGGRINGKQLTYLKQKISSLDEKLIKILVLHHPLKEIGSKGNLKALFDLKIDIFLSGHLHAGDIRNLSHPTSNHSAIIAQAGTATSLRYRGEPNTFNVIIIEEGSIVVQPYTFSEEQGEFVKVKSLTFLRATNGWWL
jgi:3',5'-cyclic AMP phosphodiesterase CpdA